jgi:hypothetical protein
VSIGWREVFAVPMLREGVPVGAIVVGWAEIGTCSGSIRKLSRPSPTKLSLQSRNVRLFNETKDAL